MKYVYDTYNIRIGERTAEEVRKSIGTAVAPNVEVTMPAKGLNVNTGLPDTAELTNYEVYDVMKEYLNKFAASLAGILEQTPPELVADISLEGIHMCGGMCQLNGMGQFLSDYIGIPAKLVPEPENCVARGTGVVFENEPGKLEKLSHLLSELLAQRKEQMVGGTFAEYKKQRGVVYEDYDAAAQYRYADEFSRLFWELLPPGEAGGLR